MACPGPVSRIARELRRAVRAFGVGLLVLWTLHTLVVTGPLLLNAHYQELLDGHPQLTVSAPLSGLIQDTTPRLVASLPANGSVLFLVDPQEVGGFAYFWLSYWFYPRHVDVSGDLGAAATTSARSIVYFQRPGSPDLAAPAGYELQSDSTYSGGAHILVFLRTDG
jgi:hypothetical protein